MKRPQLTTALMVVLLIGLCACAQPPSATTIVDKAPETPTNTTEDNPPQATSTIEAPTQVPPTPTLYPINTGLIPGGTAADADVEYALVEEELEVRVVPGNHYREGTPPETSIFLPPGNNESTADPAGENGPNCGKYQCYKTTPNSCGLTVGQVALSIRELERKYRVSPYNMPAGTYLGYVATDSSFRNKERGSDGVCRIIQSDIRIQRTRTNPQGYRAPAFCTAQMYEPSGYPYPEGYVFVYGVPTHGEVTYQQLYDDAICFQKGLDDLERKWVGTNRANPEKRNWHTAVNNTKGNPGYYHPNMIKYRRILAQGGAYFDGVWISWA
jgi:hypothetical protein